MITITRVNNAISIKKQAIVKTSIDIFPFSSPSFSNAEFKFEVIANKSVCEHCIKLIRDYLLF